MTTKVLLTWLLLLPVGALAGNDKKRFLKMTAEVGKIAARPVTLPRGEVVDFEFVANAQIFYSLIGSELFSYLYVKPGESSVGEVEGVLSSSALSASKLHQMQVASGVPVCVYETPQVSISGEVIGFEMTNSFGLRLGYNQNQDFIPDGAGATLSLSTMRLDLGLRLDDYLRQQNITAATGDAKKHDIDFSMQLGALPIGFSMFFSQSVVKTLRKAYKDAIDNLVKRYMQKAGESDWNKLWSATVIMPASADEADNDKYVIINAGLNSAIHVGDTFYVWNREFVWNDAHRPCQAGLKRAFPTTEDPIAEIRVVATDLDGAKAKVETTPLMNIHPGAIVKLKSFAP